MALSQMVLHMRLSACLSACPSVLSVPIVHVNMIAQSSYHKSTRLTGWL